MLCVSVVKILSFVFFVAELFPTMEWHFCPAAVAV